VAADAVDAEVEDSFIESALDVGSSLVCITSS
jgi:hypothetical protein